MVLTKIYIGALIAISCLNTLVSSRSEHFCQNCNIIRTLPQKSGTRNHISLPMFITSSKGKLAYITIVELDETENELLIYYCDDGACINVTAVPLYDLSNLISSLIPTSLYVYVDHDDTIYITFTGIQGNKNKIFIVSCPNYECVAPNQVNSIDLLVEPRYTITLWNENISHVAFIIVDKDIGHTYVYTCPDRNCTEPFQTGYPTLPEAEVETWMMDSVGNLRGLRYIGYDVWEVCISVVFHTVSDTSLRRISLNSATIGNGIGIIEHPVTKAPVYYLAISNYNLNILYCDDWVQNKTCLNKTIVQVNPPPGFQLNYMFTMDISKLDHLPMIGIYQYDKHELLVMHCYDMECISYWKNTYRVTVDNLFNHNFKPLQTYENDMYFGFFLPSNLKSVSRATLNILPICGPYLSGFNPDKIPLLGNTTVTIEASGVCEQDLICTAYKDNLLLDSEATINNEGNVECKIIGPENISNYSLSVVYRDSSGTSVRSIADGRLETYWKEYCPANNTCSGHGHCDYSDTNSTCICDSGYYGKACGDSTKTIENKFSLIVLIYLLVVFFMNLLLKLVKDRKYKAPEKLNINSNNFFALISYPFDFLQFSVFSLNIKATWSNVILKISSATAFKFGIYNFIDISILMQYVFWVVVGITVIWILYILPFWIKYKKKRLIQNLRKNSAGCNVIYYPSFLIIIPWSTFLMLAVARTLLLGIACTYFIDQHEPHMEYIPSLTCWELPHITILSVGFLLFMIYFPLVINSYPKIQQRDSTTDIKFRTKFLYIMGFIKMILVILDGLLIGLDLAMSIIMTIISTFVFLLHVEMEPCNVRWLNIVGSGLYFATVISCVCSVWSYFVPVDDIIPAIVLVSGIGVTIIVVIAKMCGFLPDFRIQNNIFEAFETTEEETSDSTCHDGASVQQQSETSRLIAP
eukprot:TRINITY_DN1484_c0_g1_i2.p1 TRINITY_DN1484_c0_g1~~TRINITY_DN1484_c0_g1_i2.p1  ORF type:complete len:922 (+),score=122.60 TRINITY_DN1484_c0_g1_i2:18-2783(+)